jgi:beta-aspartyl-peptidase (threonine type)
MRSVIVHGGAGREGAAERGARHAGLRAAADAGWVVLARGGRALDAVVAATVVLEDDDAFNAGRGSVLTEEGWIEMDASVMDGATLAAGAVAAVSRLRNPVRGARAVLDAGREVLLVGERACDVAARAGTALTDPRSLITERARARRASPGETVGAVACDGLGHVAAATSTGGMAGKRLGRIGDSAIIGAGTYADDGLGAVSCTGPGEAIIRLSLARGDPFGACRAALDDLRTRLEAAAGLVLVAPSGVVAFHCTTDSMPVAWRTDRGDGAADGARECTSR